MQLNFCLCCSLSYAIDGFLIRVYFVAGMKWDSFDADMLMGFEEIDMDDDVREEYPCPFCSDYFDIVGLCCHIDDEHPIEAKNGVSHIIIMCNNEHELMVQ